MSFFRLRVTSAFAAFLMLGCSTTSEILQTTTSDDTVTESTAASRVITSLPHESEKRTFTLDEQILNSGAPLIYEQTAYNVRFYNLDIELFPDTKTISGIVTSLVDIVHPLDWLVFDLDTTLTVHSAGTPNQRLSDRDKSSRTQKNLENELHFERRGGQIWIRLDRTYQPSETVEMQINYDGMPRVAPNPPWDGGFSWAETPDGHPWIGVSCQTNGADLWWPVKDHYSDRPDSVSIHLTVPNPLFAASNGRFIDKTPNDNNTSTFHWFVGSPISNYNVTVNAGPYLELTASYTSTSGDQIPISFWILPEDEDKALQLMPQFSEQMQFFENLLGPYPFRNEKYGVVQTSYLGMEHQTLIAYGAGFQNDVLFNMNAGYDDLHHHELAHEWWGNLVTVHDWKDFWIHEGFATYMQALYTEELKGSEYYHRQMRLFRSFVQNTRPLVPHQTQSSRDMRGRDVYYKGASVLHTLRYVLGDDDFFLLLRRFAYPEPAMELLTDGSALRFTSTEELKQITTSVTGRSLNWLFDVYLHQRDLPELTYRVENETLILEWIVPGSTSFPMPVPVRLNEETHYVEMDGNRGEIHLGTTSNDFEIDPLNWVLKK